MSQTRRDASLHSLRKKNSSVASLENAIRLPKSLPNIGELQLSQQEQKLVGWSHERNLFDDLDASRVDNEVRDRVAPTMALTLHHGVGWYGIGAWRQAEDYFRVTIWLAILANDAPSAVEAGCYLAEMYLAADDYKSAFHLSSQLQPVARSAGDWVAFRTISTLLFLCAMRNNRSHFVRAENRNLRKLSKQVNTPVDLGVLDDRIFQRWVDVLMFCGDRLRLAQLKTEWQALVHNLNSSERFSLRRVQFNAPQTV
jgi:hypothetical protein